jgi:acetylornithine aminotransferase/putrescine aminotransferase
MVEARQKGLMMGLKMSSDQMGPLMTRIGFEAGLLTIYANNDPSVVQILPPLIIQEDEVRMVLGILDGMLGKVEQMTSQ